MQPARLGAGTLCLVSTTLLGFLVLAPSSRAQAVLETPQQTNDRIRQLSAAARMAPHDYVIGDGDLLDIEVFDVKDLSREVRVSQTGTIGLPLIPVRLRVSGLTEIQTEQKIAEVLEADGLVSHPDVTVTVKERKNKPITVVGAVLHPLVYEADRQVTLLEVLAQAGGVSNDAGNEVIVTRPVPRMQIDESEPGTSGSVDSASGKAQPHNGESKSGATTGLPSNSQPKGEAAVPPELPAPDSS
ncbi:MAG: polysaccharide biosynthesis/export family protein [Candidatus Dormibacteraceae bacterium]